MLTEALLFLLLLVTIYFGNKKPSRLPPGEWGWPLVGRLPSLKTTVADQVKKLRHIHGDIISWRIGSQVFVFLCNFSLIKTYLSKLELSGRPDVFVYNVFKDENSHGVLFSDGLAWHNNRRFILRHLKLQGTGKSRVEAAIQHEASLLVEEVKKHTGQPTALSQAWTVAVVNIIARIVADRRYDLLDHEAYEFSEVLTSIVEKMQQVPVHILNIFPWLESVLPNFIKRRMGCLDLGDLIKQMHSYMNTLIEEHLAKLDPAHPRDLLDAYLIEMQEKRDDPNSTLCLEDLRTTISDLFMAAFDTTWNSIRWAILYLAKYPEVQARIQREIDAAVPRGTMPSLEHKDKLPYFEATMNEIQRVSSLSPLGLMRSAVQDTEIGGYDIPKGTILLGHLECCHGDPNYWEKPLEFHPEHFLDQQGKFVARRESFVPFSVGRRSCVGKALGIMNIFIFLSAMLQNFTFTAPEGEELSTDKDPCEFNLRIPLPFKVILTERK